MAWIRSVDPAEAEGRLAELYRRVASPEGQVDAILRVHGLRPRTLEAHLALYKAVLHSRPHGLSRRERELIGVVVSALNGCDYCVRHHTAGLARHLVEGDGEVEELVREALRVAGLGVPGLRVAGSSTGRPEGERGEDGDGASPSPGRRGLSDRERVMVRYAARLTRQPAEVTEAELEPLRAAGLDDASILDLNQVAAYFAYANRTVLGLGVRAGDEPLGLHPDESPEGLRHR